MKFARSFCVLSSRTISFLQQNAMTKGNSIYKVSKRDIQISPTITAFKQNQRNASSSSSLLSAATASGENDNKKTVERKFQPYDIIDKLNDTERESLRQALEHLNLDILKQKLEGKFDKLFYR